MYANILTTWPMTDVALGKLMPVSGDDIQLCDRDEAWYDNIVMNIKWWHYYSINGNDNEMLQLLMVLLAAMWRPVWKDDILTLLMTQRTIVAVMRILY